MGLCLYVSVCLSRASILISVQPHVQHGGRCVDPSASVETFSVVVR